MPFTCGPYPQELKSSNCDVPSYVTMVNTTSRHVDIIWLDYKGVGKRYGSLVPDEVYHLNTYVTHPWVFRDTYTGFELHADRSDVYFPCEWDGSEGRKQVSIHLKLSTLKERAIEVVRQKFTQAEIRELMIPRELTQELINTPNLLFGEDVPQNPAVGNNIFGSDDDESDSDDDWDVNEADLPDDDGGDDNPGDGEEGMFIVPP